MSALPIGRSVAVRVRALLILVALVAALGAAAAVTAAPASAATSEDYFFISGIGPSTVPAYAFTGSSPNGVATDANGNVYVTHPAGIAKFNSSGVWKCDYTGDNGYTPGRSYGLDVENIHATIFLAESDSNRIVMLRPNANGLSGTVYEWKFQIGSLGTGNGQFDFPQDVAVDSNHLYVTDKLNNRVQKFAIDYNANTLTWEATWGKNGGDGSYGSGNGEFWRPTGVAVDHRGHVFVADSYNYRIQELTTAGVFVAKWGVSAPASDPLYLSSVVGLDVDSEGDVYATDFTDTTSWVNKYSPAAAGGWERVTRLGGWGTAAGQFKFPWACAVDPDGFLYVTDTKNQQLKKFARDATAPSVQPAGFPTGWTKTISQPEFIASDPAVTGQYTSNGVSIWYSKTGGAPWISYLEPFLAGDFVEGDNTLTYWAKDAVGNQSSPSTVHVYYDKTAPVTINPGLAGGWSTTDVSVTLLADDSGISPIVSTEYRVLDAPAWSAYAGPFVASTEGTTTYEYRSTDAAGNVEATKTLTVSIDKTAPVTKITDVPAGWSRTPVSATFSPDDTPSGVASTEYSIDGGSTWAPGLSAAITRQGVTTLLVRSTDVAGNVEDPKAVTVRLDSVRPLPKALANKSVKRNATVKLPYKIVDVPGAQATVTIKIYKGSAFKKTLKVGTKAANAGLTYSYKCKLPKGKYSWKVYATDAAGNAQAKPGVRTLTVK